MVIGSLLEHPVQGYYVASIIVTGSPQLHVEGTVLYISRYDIITFLQSEVGTCASLPSWFLCLLKIIIKLGYKYTLTEKSNNI